MRKLLFLISLLSSCLPVETNTNPVPEQNTNQSVDGDSIYLFKVDNSSPVTVVKVQKVRNKFGKTVKHKWVVTTENGVLYYTDQKTNVGDTAFYIKNN